MIGKKFVDQKMKETKVKDFFSKELSGAGFSHAEIEKTPVGTKFIVYSSKPGLVVGRGGQNIKELKGKLEENFDYENPQIEVREIEKGDLYSNIVAERIASQLENWGVTRFKAIGYQNLERIMDAGARGTEIIITGLVPGKRSRRWRFSDGNMPKSGPISDYEVREAKTVANVPRGTIGVKVRILTSDVNMPDRVEIKEPEEELKETGKEGEENGDSKE